MHVKRLITALVGLPLFVLLIYKGPPFLFALFVGIVSVAALSEYYHMVNRTLVREVDGWMKALGFPMALALVFVAYRGAHELIPGCIVLTLILSVLISVFRIKRDPNVLDLVLRQVVGVVYIPGLLSYLVVIRNDTAGVDWLFFLFSVVFIGDAAALYAGTLAGKHKLSPLISPGKTVEGSVAGLCASGIAGALCNIIFDLSLHWGVCVLLSVTIAVAAQIGDLFESQLKRSAKVKDSGGILPGHGGVLDRIDATLFAAPVLYLVKKLVI